MYAAPCGQGQALPLTQGAALHIFRETVHHSMPRTSPVFYIAPSAISITPNANGSADDLAVYVARGAKIRVYSPGCGIGTTDASFQEWSFAGRNRRLGDSAKEYTIYGRLSKTDRTKGYLVFAPKVGGLDIAAMAGMYIGAAIRRVPILTDGVISAAAALCACRLHPGVKAALLASHLRTCVSADIRAGRGAAVDELMDTLQKLMR